LSGCRGAETVENSIDRVDCGGGDSGNFPIFPVSIAEEVLTYVLFMLCKDAKRERSSAERTRAVAADDCHGDAMGAYKARTRPLILWFFLIPALLTIAATVAVQEF